MKNYSNTGKLLLSYILTLFFYSISIILAPLFHIHSIEHHPEQSNNHYHSHSEIFGISSSEHIADSHHDDDGQHDPDKTTTLLEDMIGLARVHPGKIIYQLNLSSVVDLTDDSIDKFHPYKNSSKIYFSKPLLKPPQDYYVHSVTNLSPPQA